MGEGRAGGRAWMGGALACLAVALIALPGCGSTSASSSSDHFDAAAAWRSIEAQVSVGQRPAGSPQLRGLARRLRAQLPNGHFEPLPGEPRLRNVVGVLPGRKPTIVIGAHYDTLARPRGFVGANNGAAGTAIVIGIAHALAKIPAGGGARRVAFVLFDGEEPPSRLPEESKNFYQEGLRGSRAYAARHGDETEAMILLDYVANRGLQLPREAESSEALWGRLLHAAEAEHVLRFFSRETGPAIFDDHTPFLRAGVPAIDLIDWRYPGHSLADGIDRLSPESVDAVGEAVTQLALELREE